METELSDVYGITGFFVEDHSPSEAKFFGGFLTARPYEVIEKNPLEVPFNGFLYDCYGPSKIEGTITPGILSFGKTYDSREGVVQYSFHMSPEGIWVGNYDGGEEIGKGVTLAKTALEWEGVNMLAVGSYADGSAENLIERMIQSGQLERKVSPETGNELLIPRGGFT